MAAQYHRVPHTHTKQRLHTKSTQRCSSTHHTAISQHNTKNQQAAYRTHYIKYIHRTLLLRVNFPSGLNMLMHQKDFRLRLLQGNIWCDVVCIVLHPLSTTTTTTNTNKQENVFSSPRHQTNPPTHIHIGLVAIVTVLCTTARLL